MERCTTREEFCQAIHTLAESVAGEAWTELVERGTARPDAWLRERGGVFLRRALGAALTARAERLGAAGRCACGGSVAFRQHRPARVHTVLPGRDVEARVLYGQCATCRGGHTPALRELGVDREGFTPALRELATLASVIEPYEGASEVLLARMAGVPVSTEKLQALVQETAADLTARRDEVVPPAPPSTGVLTVGIDGGMIFVDRRWQEVKLACV